MGRKPKLVDDAADAVGEVVVAGDQLQPGGLILRQPVHVKHLRFAVGGLEVLGSGFWV